MILIEVSGSDDRPIYAQIAGQVKAAVAAGVLRPGDLVPSVRDLSRRLVINPNTTARAYRELQVEGVIETVRGTGLIVSDRAPALCRDERREQVRLSVRSVVAEARRIDLTEADIERLWREEWTRAEAAAAAQANGRTKDRKGVDL